MLYRPANALPPLRQQLREHGIYLESRPTSVPAGYYNEPVQYKRAHSEMTTNERPVVVPSAPSSVTSSPRSVNNAGANVPVARTGTQNELEAAEIMLQLSSADHALPEPKRTRRGSRY